MKNLVCVDLGKNRDFPVIGVLDRLPEPVDVLRFLERPPLKTPYPALARRIVAVATNPQLDPSETDLLLDATGVGGPVTDLVREELFGVHTATMHVDQARETAERSFRKRLPRLVPIIIGGGLHASVDALGYQHVPKSVLVGSMQVAVQNETLRIAAGIAHADTLEREMRAFKEKMTRAGNRQFEADRESDHDDLVMMLVLGTWWSKRLPRPLAMDARSVDEREAERFRERALATARRVRDVEARHARRPFAPRRR